VAEGGGFLSVKIAEEAVADEAPCEESAASALPPSPPSIIVERATAGIEIELIGGRRVRFDRDVDPETMSADACAISAGLNSRA